MFDRYHPSAEQSCQMTIEAATKALSNNDKCFESYITRGTAYYTLKKYILAIKDITSALELKTVEPGAHPYNTRGMAYHRCGSYDNAIADFTLVIKLNPQFFGAYANRALAYIRKGEYQLAREDINMAMDLSPENPVVYSHRAALNFNLKKYNDAVLDIVKALELECDQEDLESLEKILNEAGKSADIGGINFATVERVFSIVPKLPHHEQKDYLLMLKELNKRVAAKNSSSIFGIFEKSGSSSLEKKIDGAILKLNRCQINFDDTGSDEEHNNEAKEFYSL